MTTGRINQVAIVQEATFPLRPKAETVSQPPNTTASGWFSITAVAELFPYYARPPAHTHTHKRELVCVCPASDAHLHGHRALSRLVSKTRQQKHPSVIRLLCQPSPSATPVAQRLPNLACD